MNPVKHYQYHGPIADAEKAVREALQSQGFGILTEVDVQATLRAKLGVETRPYRILGACNPRIAHQSLEIEPSMGAFLPCGLALQENQSGTETAIYLQNPRGIVGIFGVPALDVPATEAADRLEAALASVADEA